MAHPDQGDRRRRLNEAELRLLAEVVEAQGPEKRQLVESARAHSLTRAQREEPCHLIAAEFTATGLREDDEPTPRGLLLEELLDIVNRPNLFPHEESSPPLPRG